MMPEPRMRPAGQDGDGIDKLRILGILLGELGGALILFVSGYGTLLKPSLALKHNPIRRC